MYLFNLLAASALTVGSPATPGAEPAAPVPGSDPSGIPGLSATEFRDLLFFTSRRPRLLAQETREECLKREQSSEPSHLERAVADLKCSQRQ
jgi:hypothetical protein